MADSDGPILIRVKAVPGASRDAIAGVLGDRLKVRVSAPPEGGKANKAIIALLARALGIKRARVGLVSGHASPEKTIAITGCTPEQLGRALEIDIRIVTA